MLLNILVHRLQFNPIEKKLSAWKLRKLNQSLNIALSLFSCWIFMFHFLLLYSSWLILILFLMFSCIFLLFSLSPFSLCFQAGLVTTLSTRTIVFGATNPKGHYDPDQCNIMINICHLDLFLLSIFFYFCWFLYLYFPLAFSSICQYSTLWSLIEQIWYSPCPSWYKKSWMGWGCVISHSFWGTPLLRSC